MKAVGVRINHPHGYVELRKDAEAQEKRYLASLKRQYGKEYIEMALVRTEFEYDAPDPVVKVEEEHA